MRQSFRASLLSSTFMLLAVSAHAQSADTATQVESVTVTGTNIRGADLANVVNVQQLGIHEIEQSGAGQVADLIKEIPSNAGTTQYNENGILSGTAQFELRGLGFSSTLVLLNGRRAGVAPLSDKSGADFVDVNQFPLAMIQRIDVLKDGSSAIYGSEAVAGVVNILTRKGFDGIELSADYSTSTNDAYSVNLATGHAFERGWWNMYATYYHQTGDLRSNFPWLMARVGGNGVPGNSQLTNNSGFPTSWQTAAINAAGQPQPATGALLVADPNCTAAGGVFPNNPTTGVPNTSQCNYDFANQIGVVPNENRMQGFFEGGYDIFDNLSYFNETGVSRNLNRIFEHVGGFANGTGVGGLAYVPASAPFNFFTADPANPRNIIYVDPSRWNNATDHAVAVVGNLRPQGSYQSAWKSQTDTYIHSVNGLDLKLPGDWHASTSLDYNYAQYDELNPLQVNANNLNKLIANGKYNPFGSSVITPNLVSPKDGVSTAANPSSVLSQVFYTSNVQRRTSQVVADLSASGPVWDFGTGPISAAIGGQYRRQTLDYVPDSLTAAGFASSPAADAAFSSTEKVWSQYAEAVIPIYDLAAVQLAVRHEDYGSGIGQTTNPKISGKLNLFDDKLGLRATWGTSFQAPTLTQAQTVTILTLVNDPVLGDGSCTAAPPGVGVNVTTLGGNLKPQTSRNFDLGIDFKTIDNLTISVDYWHYSYTNLIAAGQNAQSIVGGECVNGKFVNDPRVARQNFGISSVTTAYANVGKVLTDGIDLSATYRVSLDTFGDLTARADATYIDIFDVYGANGAIAHDARSRNFNNNFAPIPLWRASGHASWSRDIHELSLGVNLIGAYKNDQDFNAPISSFTTVDFQYAIHLEDMLNEKRGSTLFSLGMNNMFDENPPALARYTATGALVTGPLAIDRPGYDALSGANIQGRMMYVRLKQAF